jgi:uncharacterized UPF0160 family protein
MNSDGESFAKRPKLSGPLIGTHNGHFHADEALAVFLLRLLPTYHESPLVRTRDPAVLNTCHTVVDVGSEYDASRNRYDHHQREFKTTYPGHSTKLSSAGLVYMHFGKAIIAERTKLAENSEDVAVLYEKLYTDFIEAFDANDNGIPAYEQAAVLAAGIPKRFNDSGFSLASVVNRYNHTAHPAGEDLTPEEEQRLEDERFQHASAFTGQQFLMELTDAHRSWLPARAIVREAYEKRFKAHDSGKILILPGGLPWSDHLYTFEDAAATNQTQSETHAASANSCQFPPHVVLYVLFPESSAPDSKWRIRAVSIARGSFSNRKDLPDAWKGLRDEELSEVSGVPGCVFVHAAGFIGGNKTLKGALDMAKKAIAS